jgi:hypothetical protein
MIGSALSRWTMSYFAAALAFLIVAEALMVAGYGFPAAALEAPETLVLVHSVTIGWLSLLMCGALFQFVPVLVAKPLRAAGLVLPTLLSLIVGLCSLLTGFLQLAGTVDTRFPVLAPAGLLLPLGFALAAWVIARTLWEGRPLALPARFVAVGLACVIATAGFGALFTALLSGFSASAELFDFRTRILPFHVLAGFGGWLTFTAIGVSYRLLPMFMLAPQGERATSRGALRCGSAALLLLVLVAPVTVLLEVGTGPVLAVAAILTAIALGLYAADLLFFYNNRKRRNVELNIRAALGAFGMLYLSALLFAVLVLTGTLAEHAGALVFLVAFGWLSGLGLSQLYKIVPFLTWLECYGPVMGRKPTPRVQELVVEQRDLPWFGLYFLGVLAGTAALLMEWSGLFRLSAAATLIATVAIVTELVLARRLSNVGTDRRLPAGASRPRLFLPAMQQK